MLSEVRGGSQVEFQLSQEPSTPVPETFGAISKVFINFRRLTRPAFHAELALAKTLAHHIPGVRFILTVGNDEKLVNPLDTVKSYLAAYGISNFDLLLQPPSPAGLSYARDFGIWADQGRKLIVPGRKSPRRAQTLRDAELDHNFLSQLEFALDVDQIQIIDAHFEGGDIIATPDYLLMGYEMCPDFKNQQRLSRLFNTPVIALGDRQVGSAFPHIDTAVLARDDTTVIINDPQTMVDLLQSLSSRDFTDWLDQIRDWYQGKETPARYGTISHLSFAITMIEDIMARCRPTTIGSLKKSLESELRLARVQEAQLSRHFRLIKIPGFNLGFPLTPINALVDYPGGRPRIFYPLLGQPKIDNHIRKVLTDQAGFDAVHPTGLGFELMLQRAGNRCVANVLRKIV